jgi:predicted nucleic acid-binding protein
MVDYIDTSALVKWYLEEPLSAEFEAYVAAQSGVCISRLTVVELRCALARRRRSGEIDQHYEIAAVSTFDTDIRRGYLQVLQVEDTFYTEARKMIEQLADVPLRTLDALHLATAKAHRCRHFATADKTQANAAKALGLKIHTFY